MEKKIKWFDGTIDTVKAFPEEVAHQICRVLTVLQRGDPHLSVSKLGGKSGAPGLSVVIHNDGKITRHVFVGGDTKDIYVLHARERPASRKAAPTADAVELAKSRLAARGKARTFGPGSCNAFGDVGIDLPDEFKGEAVIANEIYKIIKRRKLNRIAAIKAMGCKADFVDCILSGGFTGYALRWPLVYLSRLGFDADIVFRRTPRMRIGTINVQTAS